MIGYDHRKLGTLTSSKFTRLCSAILLSMGFKVYLLLGYVPTPFVAFAVPYLDCAGNNTSLQMRCLTDYKFWIAISNLTGP